MKFMSEMSEKDSLIYQEIVFKIIKGLSEQIGKTKNETIKKCFTRHSGFRIKEKPP